jgi:hypothetical protein
MVSLDSTSRVIVLPVRVFTKISAKQLAVRYTMRDAAKHTHDTWTPGVVLSCRAVGVVGEKKSEAQSSRKMSVGDD